jgi:tRNA(Ile)-lysidine synthase
MDVFEEKLAQHWPPEGWRDAIVLVAVSGGADSVALLRGLAAVRQPGRGRLVVGHFHHGLRGAEADADAQFVVALAAQLGLDCHCGQARDAVADTSPDDRRRRSEAHAREARYRFLRELASRLGARYVATGHTADDQAETVLHRILRGTGLAGLAGIRRVRQLVPGVALIRPLLPFRRSETQGYLTARAQPSRCDSSNVDLRFTRNRIRHELLPHVAEWYNPRAVEALIRLARQAADSQRVIEALVEELRERCAPAFRETEVAFDCSPLAGVPRLLVRELLTHLWRQQSWPRGAMTYEKWEWLAEVATSPTGAQLAKLTLPGNIRAERSGDQLVLRRAAEQ